MDWKKKKRRTLKFFGKTRFVEYNKLFPVDNTFVNFNDTHCTSEKLIEKLTDHLPNFLIIENLNTNLEFKLKPLILHSLKKKNFC